MKKASIPVALAALTLISLPPVLMAKGKNVSVGSTAQGTVNTVESPIQVEGDRALDLGEYTRAESMFRSALKDGTKNQADRGYLQLGLSEALLNQGRMAEAGKEYKKAQGLIGASSSNNLRARLLDGLSWLQHGDGKMDAALDYCQKALEIRRGDPSTEQPMLVQTLLHMGYILELQGKLTQAIDAYKDALKTETKLAGNGSMIAADLHERMGSLLRRLGNSEQSKAEFQEALGIKISTGAVVAAYTPHPYWQNIQYGFYDGAPNCMRRFDQGAEQQMITANGVTVGAALRPQPVESTKTTQVDVIVRNDSGQQIQFLPTPPQLILTTPKFEFVPQVDPVKLAATVAKKGERKASWIRFWGENATTSLTSTYIGNGGGPFWGGGGWGGGGWGGGWGGGGFPYFSRSGNMSTMIQQVPNYAAQARALQRAADVSDNAQRNASSIQRSGLGPTSLPEGQSISGSFYFDTNKVQKAAFRVPIGNAVFCFEFPSTK